MIGKPASKQRGQVNKAGIEAINLRCEGLHAERTEQALEHAADSAEPDGAAMAGQQKVFHHVKYEQRAHAIIGESLPHLGREQEAQTPRMAEKFTCTFFTNLGRAVSPVCSSLSFRQEQVVRTLARARWLCVLRRHRYRS